ncbi:TPA: hypothetical protein NJ322_005031 [Vibrio parahaemolyticus]|nr:hypothetical protein [Vibrio parahaemolyticus]HCG7105675.1 hypothetical protein [Vibrio parahaemolyticus]
MSKGVIKANLGNGLYEVEVVRDIEALDAQISDLSTKKQNIENKLAQSEDKMLSVTAKKIDIQIAELERIKSNNMIFEMESVIKDDSLAVGLEVGVIERREAHKVFRRYINSPAAYDETRDGKVKAAALMNPWTWFYNTLIMQTSEVWRPRYWNCTINAISEDKLTASVTVDAIKPRGKSLYPMSKRYWAGVPAGIGETLSNYEKSKIGDKAIIDFVTNKDEPRLMIIGNTDDDSESFEDEINDHLNNDYKISADIDTRIVVDVDKLIEHATNFIKAGAYRYVEDPRNPGQRIKLAGIPEWGLNTSVVVVITDYYTRKNGEKGSVIFTERQLEIRTNPDLIDIENGKIWCQLRTGYPEQFSDLVEIEFHELIQIPPTARVISGSIAYSYDIENGGGYDCKILTKKQWKSGNEIRRDAVFVYR